MITVTGATGMLGSMVARTVQDAYPTSRSTFSVENPTEYVLKLPNRMINCIGLIKPYCDDVEAAVRINALFPHSLPPGTIQIATDCVYDGQDGNYVETDPHNATDVYGKTKSLGEASHLNNLRCSIIGPELKGHTSLHDWLLAQNTEVRGFTNHYWNGITTYHFAKICEGIIRENIELPSLQHIVPADNVNKAQLLQIIANAYGKNIKINRVEADEFCDRTLSTSNPKLNLRLWQAAGYSKPPTIKEMVEELATL